MNPNVWNIKEILSIPARNPFSSGYSSSTDSQFMLGSQETIFSRNSQPSQQSSEGSDPKILNNYHTKPLLFGIDGKDLHSRAVGVLDKFEEDKRRAKEKRESDLLTKERLNLSETLNHMQHAVNNTEKNTAACKTFLEGFDSFATALQNNLSGFHNSITQQFEKMLSQMSSQKQLLTEIEENVLKTGVASTELGSRVKGLERNMEVLTAQKREETEEHRREQNMLEEAVTLLNTLVSKHSTNPIPVRVTDIAIQTSPGLTVNTIQTSPGLTVNTIQTSPGLTVNTIQTSPGLTVNTIQTSPSLTVNTIQTSPSLTVNTIQTSPSLTVNTIQTSPSLTVNTIQTSPGLTDSMIQTSPGLTVNTIQTSPGLTDSMIQTSPELSQTLFNQEKKCLPEDKRLPLCQIENSQSEVPSQNQGSCIKVRSTAQRRKIIKRRPLMPPRRKGTILYKNSQTSTYNINRQGVSLPHDPKSLDSIQPDPQSKSVVGLEPEPRSEVLINIKPDRQLNSLDNIKPAPQSKSHQQIGETRSSIGKGSFKTPFNYWSQESASSPKSGISEKPKGLWQLFDTCSSDPFSGED